VHGGAALAICSSSALPKRACWCRVVWERSGRPSGREDQLNKLIDVRARNELPTWFTTNCSLEELEQLLTPRSYSCLVYQADVLEVTGPDLRKLCR
jgi:hypothetical protein